MAGINSANQIGHVAIESVAFGTAAAPTNSNAFKLISLTTDPAQENRQRPDKNSSLSQTVGIGGQKTASWSMRASLAGSSAAGTAPDIGPFMQAAFGKAPTVVASTSVEYTLDDLSPSLTIWNYWSPSNASQKVSIGSVVSSLSIDATGTDPIIELSGPALWVLDTDQFATADATALGGLSSFTSAPGSPVTNGNMVSLYAGSATLDGNAVTEIRSFRLNAAFNRSIPNDVKFSGLYGGAPSQERRDITFDLNVYDKAGDSNFSALKNKAITKQTVDVVIVLGNTASHTVTITLNDVLLGTPTDDDGQPRKAVNFAGCRAHASSGTAKDELKIKWS